MIIRCTVCTAHVSKEILSNAQKQRNTCDNYYFHFMRWINKYVAINRLPLLFERKSNVGSAEGPIPNWSENAQIENINIG